MKRVGIIQSNYIPWRGYFDFIASVDEFVLFDDVQYTRRDWRNRNKIKTQNGLLWLTIPVSVKGRYEQTVAETLITDSGWIDEHMRSLQHAYGRAPHFRSEWPLIADLYASCRGVAHLSDVNERFIRGITRRLGIETPIRKSSEFTLVNGKNERLIAICSQGGADVYLSGPAAAEYIDESLWNAAGIRVEFKSYAGYPEYPQLHGHFEPAVSILDLLFNTGEGARGLISTTR